MYLKVFVTPGAKREKIEKKGEIFSIAVREPATRNLANDRVRQILAELLGKPVGKVRILTGHRSRAKMFSISS